jgi:hypothetical protein
MVVSPLNWFESRCLSIKDIPFMELLKLYVHLIQLLQLLHLPVPKVHVSCHSRRDSVNMKGNSMLVATAVDIV